MRRTRPFIAVAILLLLGSVAFGQAPAVRRGIVRDVVSRWASTSYGDQPIVSEVTVDLPNGEQIVTEVEGGTVDGVTLTVSGESVPQRGRPVSVRPRGPKWEVVEQDFATFAKWSGTEMTWVLDTKYSENSSVLVESDLIRAAFAWTNTGVSSYGQTRANFAMRYGGRIPVGSGFYAKDSRHTTLFRPTLKPGGSSAIASTYCWTSNGVLVDCDVVGWSGYVNWSVGSNGCPGSNNASARMRDIFTHEFGHVSGMSHSTVAGSTMYPSYSYCSTAQRSLHADDIAGEEFLYPPQ